MHECVRIGRFEKETSAALIASVNRVVDTDVPRRWRGFRADFRMTCLSASPHGCVVQRISDIRSPLLLGLAPIELTSRDFIGISGRARLLPSRISRLGRSRTLPGHPIRSGPLKDFEHEPPRSSRTRRQFLVSGLSLIGCFLSLGSLAVMSGCGDDKGPGQVENAGDVTKTPDAMESMKAYQGQMQNRGNPSVPKKK